MEARARVGAPPPHAPTRRTACTVRVYRGRMAGLSPGTIFASDYRVERVSSSGGMGSIYVVDQLSTGRKRALKLMHPDLVKDE